MAQVGTIDWNTYGEGPGARLTGGPFTSNPVLGYGGPPPGMTWNGGGLPPNVLPPVDQYSGPGASRTGSVSGQPGGMSALQQGILGLGGANLATKLLTDKSLLDIGKEAINWSAINPFSAGAAQGAVSPALSAVSGGGGYVPPALDVASLAGSYAPAAGVSVGAGSLPASSLALDSASMAGGLGAGGSSAGAAATAAPFTASAAMLAALPLMLPLYGMMTGKNGNPEKERALAQQISQRAMTDPSSVLTPLAPDKPVSAYNTGGMSAPAAYALATGQQPAYVQAASPEVKNALQSIMPQIDKARMMHEALFNKEFGPETNAKQVFNSYKQRGLFTDADRELFQKAGYQVG